MKDITSTYTYRDRVLLHGSYPYPYAYFEVTKQNNSEWWAKRKVDSLVIANTVTEYSVEFSAKYNIYERAKIFHSETPLYCTDAIFSKTCSEACSEANSKTVIQTEF